MLRQGILATFVLAIAPLAQAADNGIYIGAGYEQSDYGLDDPDLAGFDDCVQPIDKCRAHGVHT